ncbi:uncharacterized protein ASCRUDRAFT_73844 [Ascoidea rubescens DSM 1968]|uniref:Uncharacterized protein n=1 Tax=Ascoidea rubescens DSM 1968 TaxID=1344418 RepID=A0A1D2VRB7_9ASCO|nr:hypothetical protein ASCRUDRAFT_73844 [Ascoidea rubescens DSM 1968]ODV64156.1 hypothetical protein ASCRUDRAFT_73844 [Ascoidea rubescens DSM 1968]
MLTLEQMLEVKMFMKSQLLELRALMQLFKMEEMLDTGETGEIDNVLQTLEMLETHKLLLTLISTSVDFYARQQTLEDLRARAQAEMWLRRRSQMRAMRWLLLFSPGGCSHSSFHRAVQDNLRASLISCLDFKHSAGSTKPSTIYVISKLFCFIFPTYSAQNIIWHL